MSDEFYRVICQSEDCNKSFYTYHVGKVKQCPYCGCEKYSVQPGYTQPTVRKPNLDKRYSVYASWHELE